LRIVESRVQSFSVAKMRTHSEDEVFLCAATGEQIWKQGRIACAALFMATSCGGIQEFF
jgi:hypothetical protein